MIENVSAVVDSLSNHLFMSANVSRKAIQEGNLRKVIDPSLSSYVQPFKLPSDPDSWTTNIASTVRNPIDLNVKISTFSKGKLSCFILISLYITYLHLHPNILITVNQSTWNPCYTSNHQRRSFNIQQALQAQLRLSSGQSRGEQRWLARCEDRPLQSTIWTTPSSQYSQ